MVENLLMKLRSIRSYLYELFKATPTLNLIVFTLPTNYSDVVSFALAKLFSKMIPVLLLMYVVLRIQDCLS